ncbi:MAG: hypothetical protein ONB46_07065 [candidate division KSB1 bacterium]|nr:hypothetical protein [candidate division KSB1 bacterium]MDZ7368280.1 hypothetical protein [candidate division KSB1 bacterium]MDZ7406140.1 hypothetical protein [candidate division KSB1 bacterium]
MARVRERAKSVIQPLEEPEPPNGSTDVADVSWMMSAVHVSVLQAGHSRRPAAGDNELVIG